MKNLWMLCALCLVSCGEQGLSGFSSSELLIALIPNDATVYYQQAILTLKVNNATAQTDTFTNNEVGFPAQYFVLTDSEIEFKTVSYDLTIDGVQSTVNLGTWDPNAALTLSDTNSDGTFAVVLGKAAAVQMVVAQTLHTAASIRDSFKLSYALYGSQIQTSSSSSTCTSTSGTVNGINSITDCRDGQNYATVMIGNQTWMAQNLNYAPASGTSWCYNNTTSNCTTYGRLYDYSTAQTACPTNWHLPDTTEWNTLEAYVGGANYAGTELKASSTLWTSYVGIYNVDAYGFKALPAGSYSGGLFGNMSTFGAWWTSSSIGSDAYERRMYYSNEPVYSYVDLWATGFSIRCIMD